MAEHLIIAEKEEKTDRYETLIPQIQALIEDEPDVYANLANTAAALHQTAPPSPHVPQSTRCV